jgi:PhoPQ-activated pathogenicity-related protein
MWKEQEPTAFNPKPEFHGRLDDRPLFQYVNRPDHHYKYVDTGYRLENKTGSTWTGYVLNMTSQQWMNDSVVSVSVWTHQVVVIVPSTVRYPNISAIYATGGKIEHNADGPPKILSEDIIIPALLSEATGTICATLYQVPEEPIVFASDPSKKQRIEDAFVAYTWVEYLRTGNASWVNLLPMVKSVVRAMDTVQHYANDVLKVGKIESFVIAGASKRGWTTWLTGAVDTRIVSIMPIVFDMLNFQENVMHTYRALGGWSFAFVDYWNLNLTELLGAPSFKPLADIIDPLQYASYLSMPKLVIDATGDEFFATDDDKYWWGQIPGETLRLMLPNAEHTCATGLLDLLPGIISYYTAIVQQVPRPQLSWVMDYDKGTIVAKTTTKPDKVYMYWSNTFGTERRDFRLIKGDTKADPCKFIPVHIFGTACLNPVFWVWESIVPDSVENGVYTYSASQPMPDGGWRGFLLMFHFPGPNGTSYRLTTQANIIPNTLPFPTCVGTPEGCHGQLV